MNKTHTVLLKPLPSPLLLIACLFAFAASSIDLNAQSVESRVLVNNGQPNIPVLNNSEVLFEQPRSEETGGIVTGSFEGLGTAVYSADDFTLEDPATITRLSSTGFQYLGTFTDQVFLGQTYYVYADDNGQPAGNPYEEGSEVFSLTLADGDNGLQVIQDASSYTIVMDL